MSEKCVFKQSIVFDLLQLLYKINSNTQIHTNVTNTNNMIIITVTTVSLCLLFSCGFVLISVVIVDCAV